MKTKLNPHIWLIILLCFIVIYTKNIISGDIFYFLHPKMLPYIIFSLIIFIILFIERLLKLLSSPSKPKNINWGMLVFVIPIFLSFNQPHALTGQALNSRNANIGIQKPKEPIELNNNVIEATTEPSTNYSSNLEIEINPQLQAEAQLQSPDNLKNNIPNVSEDSSEFLNKIYKLQSSIDNLKGTEMTIKGFVYRDESLSNKQLVVARLYVSCCVADASVIGVLVEDKNTANYANETWIKVTGTVDSMSVHDDMFDVDYNIPVLTNPTIEKIDPLDSLYVFD